MPNEGIELRGVGLKQSKPLGLNDHIMMDFRYSSLYLDNGSRKYLNADERARLLRQAQACRDAASLFCWVLLETGCRISEALALRRQSINLRQQAIIFETLKKRRRGIFRAVPVSDALLTALDVHFAVSSPSEHGSEAARLWCWSRATAWRRVRSLMEASGISGPHACPKGFRHGFGIAAVSAGIPLNLVQRWLGHSDMKTTAIYADAWGAEERGIASRMWAPARERRVRAIAVGAAPI